MSIAKEGYPFILLSLLLTGLSWLVHPALALLFLGVAGLVVFFFRSPHRVIPEAPGLVVSPADGTVLTVDLFQDDRYLKDKVKRVVIFLSVFNVHVNRIPLSGVVKKIIYHPGRFLMAFADKASLDNEQNGVVMADSHGRSVAFVQIAGWVARRIVCYLKEDMPVTRGQLYGLIRFGSRLDIYLPEDYVIVVKKGDKVKGGASVIAQERGMPNAN